MNIDLIKPYTKNAKKHDKKQIQKVADSIKRFGFVQPIVIDKNNEIVIGHCRYEAAKLLDLKEVPTISVETLSDEEVKALRLADNKLNESDWDMGLAIEELKGLSDEMFDLTGFDKDLLIEPDEKDDQIPENVEPIAKLGDIWQLGRHRVACADSTDKEAVARLMEGKKADMVFTDPPYGIGYEYNQHKDEQGEKYTEFCKKWFECISNNQFIIITTGWKYQKFWWNLDAKDVMYWTAMNKRTGGSYFHFRKTEPLFVWGRPKNIYDFDTFQINTENIKGLRDLHTCPKPVALVTAIISAVDRDDIVLDIFLGSGTTLIACEKTNRICYGMELDPKYVDVILTRWCELTRNKKVVKNGTEIDWI